MMKQMTIKKKVTLWYTGIIALILGMVLVFMFYFVDKVGISATEEEVSAAVTGFSANFQFQDGTYYLSEDTQFYQDGVMFCVYDDNGKLLYGTMPEKFPKQTILKSHTPRVITSGSSKWMVYDSVHTYGKNKASRAWFRLHAWQLAAPYPPELHSGSGCDFGAYLRRPARVHHSAGC